MRRFCSLVALFFLFIFLPVSLVTEAFSKLGLTPVQGILMFIAILLGRTVNLPVYTSDRLVMVARRRSVQFTMDETGRHVQIEQDPSNELKKQVIAVNFGGCIMPVLLSLTFLVSLHVAGKAEGVYPWLGFTMLHGRRGGAMPMTKPDVLTGFARSALYACGDDLPLRLFFLSRSRSSR